MSIVDQLLKGSIDMHIHASPDPRVERRVNALQAALQAQEAGMRAIVLKSHEYPTAPLAFIVNQTAKDILVFGSITLNYDVGGLNPRAVETSAKLGAKVVWMPTFSSANDFRKKNVTEGGIALIDSKGKLFKEVKDILEIIKNYHMVLATGHISAAEVSALVEEARKMDIRKIVITHPLAIEVGSNLSVEGQTQMAKKGAFIEQTFCLTSALFERLDPMKLVEAIKGVGIEHSIVSTDFGQDFNPAPAEGMRMAIATMLTCGMTEKEMEILVKTNPGRLLDLI